MSLILPSYQSGFAPRDYEPAYPSLWQGCVGAWAPLLGPTGLVLRDAAGKNDGTLVNGPTWQISGGKYALDFDGTDDYVTVSRRPVFDITRVRTVSAWIKATTFDGQFGYNDIALCDFIGGTREWVFATYTNDGNASTAKLIFIMFGTSGGSAEADTTAEVLESNKWLHVCAVNDGSYTFGGISLYVNGVKYATTDLSTGTFGSPNVSATNAFQIGRRVGNSGFDLHWNGQIDDVRLYHRQLSESEIKLLSTRRGIAHEPIRRRRTFFRGFSPKKKLLEAKITSTIPGSYQTGYAPRDGEPVYPELWKNCVGAWSAGLGPSNLLRDNAGKNHGTLVNGPTYQVSGGQYALSFDGSNRATTATLTHNIGTGNFCVATWVRPTAISAAWRCIWSNGTATAPALYSTTPGNSWGFYWGSTLNAGSALAVNEWVHLCVVRNNSVLYFYKNGRQEPNTYNNTTLMANAVQIFASENTGSQVAAYPGEIDDFRIYSRTLSESEIKTLATRRNIAYEFKRPRTLFRAYDPIKQVGVGKITSIIPGGYHTGVGGVNNEPAYPELTKGLVGGWCPSLGVTGGLLRDNSGQGNHGTLTSMDPATDWVVSGGKYALDFDGSNDYTVTSRLLKDCPNNYTVCLWANIRALPTSGNLQSILSSYDVVGGNHTGLDFRLYNNSGTQSIGFIMGDNNGGPAGNDQAYTLPTNTWFSLIARRLGSSLNCFLNGASITTHSAPEGIANTKSFYIGTFGPYTPLGGQFLNRYFNGVLDDIRIYDRALSDNEIRLLASRRGIGYDFRTHRSYSKTQSSGLRKKILTGLP